MERASGILMHITSLPSDYGIGTFGRDAYEFVDFLEKSGQKYWQILPLGPTSYGDSPYQSFSTHAGNPYFIDLDTLACEGLISGSDYKDIVWGTDSERVDYEKIYNNRFKILKKAFKKFKETDLDDFYKFLDDNEMWVSNYALFMSAKTLNDNKSWQYWGDGLKKRDPHTLWEFKNANSDEVMFWEFLQYKFFEQWSKLKSYANEKGIKIIGDIPIYVALDSADVWVNPDLFELSDDLSPLCVAGCPPDAFSPTGQLWGNPIYRWSRHKETGYDWWLGRLKSAAKLYDIVRIDHFRGFDEFYSIPYGDETAENGSWERGPGIDLFNTVKEKIPGLCIIAEDLGHLTESVHTLLKDSGFPGMKVLSFAFSGGTDNAYLPHNHIKNSVCYIGTHDNDTIMGWLKNEAKETVDFCKEYIMAKNADTSEFLWKLIKTAFMSVSDTVIIQMQDYLELNEEARMNTPSTSSGNWQWRMKKDACTDTLSDKIKAITKIYGR